MTKPAIGAFLCALSLLCAPVPGSTGETLSSQEILDHVDDLFRGNSSFGTFSMKVKTAHYTREIRMEGWSRGKDHSLIRILSPSKERGMATLKAGKDIWNYLPKVRRVIKVPSSMMGGSWMGSHFTNDDLVKQSRMKEDYDYKLVAKPGDGGELYVIECIPKPDAPVVWGKVVVKVTAGKQPNEITYFDEKGELVRTMKFLDITEMGGRTFPARMRVEPADDPGEFTEVSYGDMEFDVKLDDRLFTLQALKR